MSTSELLRKRRKLIPDNKNNSQYHFLNVSEKKYKRKKKEIDEESYVDDPGEPLDEGQYEIDTEKAYYL